MTAAPDDGAAAAEPLPTVEELIRHRLSSALGGWRGSLELALPTVAFVVLWSATHDVRTSVLASAVVVVLLGVVRVLQRSSLRHVAGAVVATALAAFFALRSGRGEDYYLPGILTNAAYALATLASILVRWPAVGFIVGAGDPRVAEDPFGWRRDPAVVRVCSRLTWVLVVVYLVRVAVMYPLYAAGEVGWLGVGKIALGWPLWVLALAVMAWLLMRGETPQQVETADSDETYRENHLERPPTGPSSAP